MSNQVDRDMKKSTPTFFMYANKSIMPAEDFFTKLMIHGYEVYYLPEERITSPEDQVDVLAKIFDEFIVFINISHVSRGPKPINWPFSISKMMDKYKDRIKIGVIHQEKLDSVVMELQDIYLMKLKIQGGCVSLADNINENEFRIGMVLSAAEARGGEKRRAKRGDLTGRVNFYINDKKINGIIINISIRGMLILIEDDRLKLSEGLFIKDVQLILSGGNCIVNSMVVARRFDEKTNKEVHVLIFRRKLEVNTSRSFDISYMGSLDEKEESIVNNCIYSFSKRNLFNRILSENSTRKKQ